jgi:predicted transposase YbfD/YdcC
MEMDTESWVIAAEALIDGPLSELDDMPPQGKPDSSERVLERLAATALHRLIAALSIVADPRKPRGRRHSLMNVLVIAVLGCVCGSDNAEALEDWGVKEKDWLSTFLNFEHGTPSQDVFLRVLGALDPATFRTAFLTWAREIMSSLGLTGQIAVDGQTHRGSHDRAKGQKPIHVLSALACESGLVLGQEKTDVKSNEITALPALLQLLYLKGALVSVDAMGCQLKVAKTILDRGGDYLFGLKGNQSNLQAQTAALFGDVFDTRKRTADEAAPPSVQRYQSTDGGHGRIETREAVVCNDFKDRVPAAKRFPSLSTLVAIVSTREDAISGKSTTETRLYVSSRKLTGEQALNATRKHWAVENKLHWCLDVTFGQDGNRTRTKHAAQNLGVVRTFALNLVRAYTGDKLSIPRRRRLCDYRLDYRLALLAASR